jgi:tripartite-type tricarboxylate transporter receptor subunit TctC
MEHEIRRKILINPTRLRPFLKGWSTPILGILLCFLILGSPGWNQEVYAQVYPTRPINMLIGFAPGATTDICGRLIAKEAEKFLGQEIVPINKPGGGGAVAAGILASSRGDGYTILADVSAALTNSPHLETVNYDPLKDFAYLFQFAELVPIYVVPVDSPHKSFKDVMEFARKNPGKFSVGTPGFGTSPHLAMELIKVKEKIDIAVIPFAGSAPAITSLLGGHITCVGTSLSTIVPHIKAGKVRALAVTTDQRDEAMPDVPTLKELGYPYAVLMEVYMLASPKATPPAIVEKLIGAFRKAAETSEYRTRVKALHSYPNNPLYGERLKAFIEQDFKRNGEIIKDAKLGN